MAQQSMEAVSLDDPAESSTKPQMHADDGAADGGSSKKKKSKKKKKTAQADGDSEEQAGGSSELVVPTVVDRGDEAPDLSGDDPLGPFGMSIRNAKGRAKLRNLQRLCNLVGSNRGMADDDETVSKKLEHLVLHGDRVNTITEARANVAELKWCAGLMHEDVSHLLNHEDFRTEAFDKDKAVGLSAHLQKILLELEARAGQPEEMKSERAERLREKLEKKLLPTLKKEIPRQAERLRFLLQDVIHYLRAEPLLQEEEPPEPEPAPAAKEEFKEWETKDEEQPDVTEEEARLLAMMGWSGK